MKDKITFESAHIESLNTKIEKLEAEIERLNIENATLRKKLDKEDP